MIDLKESGSGFAAHSKVEATVFKPSFQSWWLILLYVKYWCWNYFGLNDYQIIRLIKINDINVIIIAFGNYINIDPSKQSLSFEITIW